MIYDLVNSRLWPLAGWTMLHCLWVGLIIGAVAWLVRQSVRRLSPDIRYAVALAFFAVQALLPLPVAVYVYRSHASAAPALIPAASPMVQESSVATTAAGSGLTTGRTDLRPENRGSDLKDVAQVQTPVVEPAVNRPAESIADSPHSSRHPQSASDFRDVRGVVALVIATFAHNLPWLWLVGAPTTFLLLATGFLGAERLRRQSMPIDDVEVLNRLRRLAGLLKVRVRVVVGVCDRIAGPILVGIVRPMILLPSAALMAWSPNQLEMVLLHELSHIRRRDNLVNLLQRIVEATLFFVPSVWSISTWVRREREHCCDRCVVAHTGKARDYAETLVQLADRRLRGSRAGHLVAEVLASSMAEHQVLDRVRQILKSEDEAMKISRSLFASLLMLFVATAVSAGWYGMTLSAAQEEGAKLESAESDSVSKPEKENVNETAKEAEKDSAKDATAGQIQPVEAADVKLETPPAKPKPPIRINGVLSFLDDVTVASDRVAVLESVKVRPGDVVKKGDALASFTRDDVEQAELELRIAQAKAEAAALNHKRLLELRERGSITAGELDRGKLDLKVAELELQRQNLTFAGVNKPLSAPLAGSVVEVFKRSGESVKPGDAVMRLVNFDRLIVEGNIEIKQPVPQRDQTFRFTLKNYEQRANYKPQVFEGKIDFVSPQLDKVASTVGVRGVVDNRDGILRAGMKGTIELHVDNADGKVSPDDHAGGGVDNSTVHSSGRLLGMQFVAERPRDDSVSKKSPSNLGYSGGLEIGLVDPNGPAAEAGISDGDILVGLGLWETANFANAEYVLTHPDVKPLEPLKFYILRERETLYGYLKFEAEYVENESWNRWLDSRSNARRRGEQGRNVKHIDVDQIENMLGLRIAGETPAKSSPYIDIRGGVQVTAVDLNGPAGKGGIRDGDILVGLDRIAIRTKADLVSVFNGEIDFSQPFEFFAGRDLETMHGQITLDENYKYQTGP